MTAQELKDYIDQLWTRVGSDRISGADMRAVGKAIVDFAAAIDVDDAIPDWTALLTFQTDGSDDGKYCKHPDSNGKKRIFETKVDDNMGNEPPTNPAITEDTNWIEISASSGSAINEWAPGVYGAGLVIVFHNHSVDGRGLYILLDPVRPFTSADIEAEITAGKWELLGGVEYFRGYYTSLVNLQAAVPTGKAGDYAIVDAGVSNDAKIYVWDDDDDEWLLSGAGITPDASETLKGIVEEATDMQMEAGTAIGETSARLYVNPAKLATWWTNIKAAVATVAAKWTFNNIALTSQIESGKKIACYIDLDGTLTKLPWLEYDTTNKKITITGIDSSLSSASVEVLNDALDLIARFLNNGAVEIGGTVFNIQVDDSISSGNASVTINTNQANAFQLISKIGTIFLQIDSTTGAPRLLLKQAWKESIQGLDFEVVHTCFEVTVSTTAGGTTIIGSIPIATDESIHLKVNHLLAIAPDGSTVGGDAVGLFRNVAGTMTEDAKTVNERKNVSVTATWTVDDNNGTKTVDIIFTNNTGTGLAYNVMASVSYLKKLKP